MLLVFTLTQPRIVSSKRTSWSRGSLMRTTYGSPAAIFASPLLWKGQRVLHIAASDVVVLPVRSTSILCHLAHSVQLFRGVEGDVCLVVCEQLVTYSRYIGLRSLWRYGPFPLSSPPIPSSGLMPHQAKASMMYSQRPAQILFDRILDTQQEIAAVLLANR